MHNSRYCAIHLVGKKEEEVRDENEAGKEREEEEEQKEKEKERKLE